MTLLQWGDGGEDAAWILGCVMPGGHSPQGLERKGERDGEYYEQGKKASKGGVQYRFR
jgi:hypothetical protein